MVKRGQPPVAAQPAAARPSSGGDPSGEPARSNVRLVRNAYRLRLDGSRAEDAARSIDGFLALLSPDIRFLASPCGLPTCLGRDQVAELLDRAVQQWAECSFAVEEVTAVDATRVLACGTTLARPAGKTEVYEVPFANLWTIKDGLATRIESFADRREALEWVKASQ
jgi:ketosteroid isomerase-like protein